MSLTINGSGGGTPVGTPTIETGSYVGTGTYGSSKPNSITFNGTPVFVFIRYAASVWASDPYAGVLIGNSTYGTIFNTGNYANTVTVSVSGNTITWYSTGDASKQLNASSGIYHYFALTI